MTFEQHSAAHAVPPLTSTVVAIPLGETTSVTAMVRTIAERRVVGIVFGPPASGRADRLAPSCRIDSMLAVSVEDLGLRDGSWARIEAPGFSALQTSCEKVLDRLALLPETDFCAIDPDAIGTLEQRRSRGMPPRPVACADVTLMERSLASYFGVPWAAGAETTADIRLQRLLAAELRTEAGRNAVFLHRADMPEAKYATDVLGRLERLGFNAGIHALSRGASIYAVDTRPLSYPALRLGSARVRAVVEEYGGHYTSWEAVTEHGTMYSGGRSTATDLSLTITRGTFPA